MTTQNEIETARLESLAALNVMDSNPESAFDNLVSAAASICDTPISLITLLDADRQWFKANYGLQDITQTTRASSFCTHTIEQDEVMEVQDAGIDPRFANNPYVNGHPNIKFYAGAPLLLKNGAKVGSLCVIDTKSKKLSSHQLAMLEKLSEVAVDLLESRHHSIRLQRRESEMTALADSSPLGICSYDLNGSCTYVNKNWQSICDMSEEEALGFGWTNVIHPEDKKPSYTYWSKCMATFENIDSEFRIVRKDGSIRHCRIVTNSFKSIDGVIVGFVGSLEDITSIKNQKESLRKINRLLQQTGTLANVGGWELDLKDNTLLWTEQTCLLHKLPIDYQPQVDTAINFYAPEARPVIKDALNRAISEGRGWDLELPLICADGSSIWVRVVGEAERVDGETVRVIGAIQNINEKVMQRQAIEYAHEQIATATESGNIGVWDWNPISNKLSWTPKMFALFGHDPETTEASYDLWSSSVHPEDREIAEKILSDAVHDVTTNDLDTEFRVLWPDNSVHNIRATAQITRDSKGKALRFLGVNWDTTSLHTLRSELIQKHDLLEVTLQSIGDAVITSDTSGNATWLNPTAEQLTGWLSHEAKGMPVSRIFNIVNETTRKPSSDPVLECLQSEHQTPASAPNTLITRDGREYGIEESASPIFNNDGDLLGVVLVFRDVTEQRRRDTEMRYRATHDSLTGLVNRIEFETRMQLALDDAQKTGKSHSLMFIDLDQFKLVNDACGHAEGDLLLQQIAKLLSNNVSSKDVIGRLGGDEFAILLEDSDTTEAQIVAQRICQCMDDYSFVHEERRFRIGTSIGLVPLDKRWNNIESATLAADSACYAAKDAGRNRVHLWFDTDKSAQARQEDTQWANRLATALSEDGFVLHVQKIDSMENDSRGVIAEVLIRMDDENGSLIPPNSFLPAAERFSIATRIDAWVVNEICEVLSSSANQSAIEMLCVNLSAQSVGDFAFQEKTLSKLAELDSELRERLCIDITETALVSNFSDVSNFVNNLRSLDVKVALDHFGTSSPTYNYLKNVDIDFIKIDGKLIQGMTDDPIDASAVRSIIDIASVMNIKTLAAHVEDQAALELVRSMGINLAQGFFVHAPERLDKVMHLPSKQTTA